jgi:hypothetical protein
MAHFDQLTFISFQSEPQMSSFAIDAALNIEQNFYIVLHVSLSDAVDGRLLINNVRFVRLSISYFACKL